MRFIHTADWHLGKLFHGLYLTDDQVHVLHQLVSLAKDARVDAVLIAGDVFDRAVPPPDAVDALDDALCRLALDAQVPVIFIAGNHDSPQRLAFASRLLGKQRVHVFSTPIKDATAVTLEDKAGAVDFFALPYAEPPAVRACLGDEQIHTHDAAMRCQLDAIRQQRAPGRRAVVLAHAFVQGGQESESERPLAIGGACTVDASCFDGFDYVALGHLHGPQSCLNGRVHYSGSLLKYSFSEATQRKVVKLVEMDAAGQCNVEQISLSPRHDVRCIRGLLADILKGPADGQPRDDYLDVFLEDKGALLDPMGQLRNVYPNVLHIGRPSFADETGDGQKIDHTKLDDGDLFRAFFDQVTGDKIADAEVAAFGAVVDEMRRKQREAE